MTTTPPRNCFLARGDDPNLSDEENERIRQERRKEAEIKRRIKLEDLFEPCGVVRGNYVALALELARRWLGPNIVVEPKKQGRPRRMKFPGGIELLALLEVEREAGGADLSDKELVIRVLKRGLLSNKEIKKRLPNSMKRLSEARNPRVRK